MPQTAEVIIADRLRRFDLDADYLTGCVLKHHVHLDLVAVTIVEQLNWLLIPGELARNLADRKVFQQRPHGGGRVFGSILRQANESSTKTRVGDDQLGRGDGTGGEI